MRARPPLDGAAVLITGASSGIGREIARQLAPRARALVLVARREDRLEELARELKARHPGLHLSVQPCDLASRDETSAMLTAAMQAVGSIDVLVNSAGFGDLTLLERSSFEKVERMIRVNVLALTQLTHDLLGPMIRRGRGGILNVSSTMGLMFLPAAAVYAGTKHYVTSFTESLRAELRGTGVVVTQVCPGPVATEFMAVAGNPTPYAVPKIFELNAERCARIALRAFGRGKALVIPGALMPVLMALGRLSPRPILRFVLSLLGRLIRRLPYQRIVWRYGVVDPILIHLRCPFCDGAATYDRLTAGGTRVACTCGAVGFANDPCDLDEACDALIADLGLDDEGPSVSAEPVGESRLITARRMVGSGLVDLVRYRFEEKGYALAQTAVTVEVEDVPPDLHRVPRESWILWAKKKH
jgi:hypothetical protein